MKVIIVGFGNAGKHYLNLLILKKIKEIFIVEKNTIPKSKFYKKISFTEIKKKKLFFDFAFISSPSGLHYSQAKFFLRRNSNVLIEKPFVLNLRDAKDLIKISDKTKKKCWTALQNRHNKSTVFFRKIINQKKIGKVCLVDCSMYWHRNDKYYSNGWRGTYKLDGGVLSNQAIHLLDILINTFGKIKYYDVFANFNKKKLEAEDLIIINFVHKSGVFSSFKATTRAHRDYKSSIDVIGDKGRCLVKGISLNTFHMYKKEKLINIKKVSEQFKLGLGPVSGMGFGHQKILDEFISNKLRSSQNLEIKNNIYILELIHSIYNTILRKKNFNIVKNINSKLGNK
jgi:UDP-N-acetyl-2-amino-2-deoxyglucuronate dehydrogenase